MFHVICDAFGSSIILIGSDVEKLSLNIHQGVVVLHEATKCTVAVYRHPLTIAELASIPLTKVRDSRGAQWTYFPSVISGLNVPEEG